MCQYCTKESTSTAAYCVADENYPSSILTKHMVSRSSALTPDAGPSSNMIIIFNPVVGIQLLALVSVLSMKHESSHCCLSSQNGVVN